MTYTALLSDGTMSISWDDGEYTGTYDDTAPAELDAFAGVWNPPAEVEDKYILTFSGAGVVHVYNVDYVDKYVSYEVAENVATFSVDSKGWACTVNGDSMVVESSYGTVDGLNYTRQVEAQLDAFAGTWNPPAEDENQYILTFSGTGTVNVFRQSEYSTVDETVEYTVDGNVATFSADWCDWTCTLDGDSMTVVSMDSDRFVTVNTTYTKEA